MAQRQWQQQRPQQGQLQTPFWWVCVAPERLLPQLCATCRHPGANVVVVVAAVAVAVTLLVLLLTLLLRLDLCCGGWAAVA